MTIRSSGLAPRVAVLLSSTIVLTAAVAQSPNPELQTDCDDAYRNYIAQREGTDETDKQPTADAAQAALEVGRELYGEEHEETAKLALNYAVALEEIGSVAAASRAYADALGIYDKVYGEKSPQHVQLLMRLGALDRGERNPVNRAYIEMALAMQKELAPDDALANAELAQDAALILARAPSLVSRATEILSGHIRTLETAYGETSSVLVPFLMTLAQLEGRISTAEPQLRIFVRVHEILAHSDPEDVARAGEIDLQAGRLLLDEGHFDEGREYLEKAYATFSGMFGLKYEGTIEARLALAELTYNQERFRRAEDDLLSALELIAGNPAYRSQEIHVRTMLAVGYEQDGKSKAADPHVAAIVKLAALEGGQQFIRLDDHIAIYPSQDEAMGLEGVVYVEFTVDELGQTQDHRTGCTGSSTPAMKQAAIAAVKRFRFVPTITKDGPVATPNIIARIEFLLQ